MTIWKKIREGLRETFLIGGMVGGLGLLGYSLVNCIKEDSMRLEKRRIAYEQFKPVREKIKNEIESKQIYGKPLSVSTIQSTDGLGFKCLVTSIALEFEDGTKDLYSIKDYPNDNLSRIEALVRSEINDGDNEPIGLYMKYHDDFDKGYNVYGVTGRYSISISAVSANGIKENVRKEDY